MAEKFEPLVAGKLEPLVAEKFEPLAAAKFEPLVAAKFEPLVAEKFEPLVAGNVEPLVAGKFEPLVAENVEPLVAAKKVCHPERSAAARSRGTATKLGDCGVPPDAMIEAVPRLRAPRYARDERAGLEPLVAARVFLKST